MNQPAPPPGDAGRTLMLGGNSLEGTRLGNCQLQKRIGAGAMGEVWLAHHVGLNKSVAIKLLSRDLVGGPSNVQRFLREAQMAASLEHPNVVQVFDVGESQGLYYLAMQYVEGKSLDKVLEEKGKLGLAESLAYVRRIALALGAAHKLGIVHRDIKPANVLLSKDGAVKVADFGLARGGNANSSLSVEGQIVGTPFYMSPEQAQGIPVDPRADLYSLGATFYHFVTGRRVFEGDTSIAIILKHVNEAPKPPQQIDPSIPAPVSQIILKLLAKNPKDRFQTAEDVARAVAALEGGATARIAAAGGAGPSADRILELGGESMLDLFAPSAAGSVVMPQAGGDTLLDMGAGAPTAPAPSGAESLFIPPSGGGETLLDLPGRGAAPGAPPSKPPTETKKGGVRNLDLKDNSPETMARQAGKFVVGKYHLHTEVKKEKDGLSVWEGENIRTQAKVQVTLFKSDTTDAIRAFYRKAAETTEVRHPGILRVIEAGSDTDAKGRVLHFLAVDLVHTTPLTEVVAGRTLNARQVVNLVAQVCDTMEALHKKKQLHGEVTPWELLVEPPERALIRLYKSPYEIVTEPEKAKALALAATAYLSPEQVPDVEAVPDATTDVYRCGAILYWAATGRAPYSGAAMADVYRKILEADPPAPKALNPKIDPELDEIIRAAMNRVRELRIQSCAELAAKLRRYLKTEPKPEQAVTTRKLPAKGLKARFLIYYRAHKLQTLAGIAAVVLALGGGVGWLVWDVQEKAAKENEFSRAYLDAIRLHGEGKYGDALVEADRALKIRPDATLFRIRGECERRFREETALKKAGALALLARRAASTDQELQDAHGQLEAAVGELSKSLGSGGPEDTDPRPWSVLGETQLALGNYEKADEALHRSMQLNGKDPKIAILHARAWMGRALLASHVIRLMLGRPESDPRVADWGARAAESLRRPSDPARVGRDASLADLFLAATRGEAAEVNRLAGELQRSSATQPPAELVDLALAKLLAPAAQPLAELDEALRQEPHHALALVVRAVRRAEIGKLEDALSDFNRAVALRPKSAAFLLLRSRARQLVGQLEGALTDLASAEVLAGSAWEYAPYAEQIRRTLPQGRPPAPK